MFAEVRRLGGCVLDFERLVRNTIDDPLCEFIGPLRSSFIYDPTELPAEEPYARFWQDTVRWIIAHRDAISDEECSLILSWAMHEYTEGQREGAQPFFGRDGVFVPCSKGASSIEGNWNGRFLATNGRGTDGTGRLKTHLSADGHLRS